MAFPLGKEWQISDTALFTVSQRSTTAADTTNQLRFFFPTKPQNLLKQNSKQNSSSTHRVQETRLLSCTFKSPKLKFVILQLPALLPPTSQGFGFSVLFNLGLRLSLFCSVFPLDFCTYFLGDFLYSHDFKSHPLIGPSQIYIFRLDLFPKRQLPTNHLQVTTPKTELLISHLESPPSHEAFSILIDIQFILIIRGAPHSLSHHQEILLALPSK